MASEMWEELGRILTRLGRLSILLLNIAADALFTTGVAAISYWAQEALLGLPVVSELDNLVLDILRFSFSGAMLVVLLYFLYLDVREALRRTRDWYS